MTCRWKDEHGDNLYDTFIPEVERPAIAQDGDVPELQPGDSAVKRGSGNRGDQPIRVLCFTSTVAMYISGSHTFVVFTPATRR